MKRKEIEARLKTEFGFISAMGIMEVLYPNHYGRGKGDVIKVKPPKVWTI